jgi:hypothetical protein
LAITLASRSIWNMRPRKRSALQRPSESVLRSYTPEVVKIGLVVQPALEHCGIECRLARG